MNKLFDPYTWKFNQTGLAEKRSKEYCSKYGNGQSTTHDPTVKAILYYATAMRDFSVSAIGTYDSVFNRIPCCFLGKCPLHQIF